jgi:hypothetical protein
LYNYYILIYFNDLVDVFHLKNSQISGSGVPPTMVGNGLQANREGRILLLWTHRQNKTIRSARF